MSGDVDDVLAAIDGALADPDIPDGMRWLPDPAAVRLDPWAERFAAALCPPWAPPPAGLREKDPRAYALQARRTRGTEPDRQRQHQPCPRRHT